MSNPNDEKILQLKKQIEEKRKLIQNSERFTPITNASLDFRGVRYNLHTLNDRKEIQALAVEINLLVKSAEELGYEDYIISGAKPKEWLSDLKSRLAYVDRKTEQVKLNKLEEKLQQLLSNEKRVELELDDIAKLI